jgi:hypothetical protein
METQRPHCGVLPQALKTEATLAAPFSTVRRTDLQLMALQTQTYMPFPGVTGALAASMPDSYCKSLSPASGFLPTGLVQLARKGAFSFSLIKFDIDLWHYHSNQNEEWPC